VLSAYHEKIEVGAHSSSRLEYRPPEAARVHVSHARLRHGLAWICLLALTLVIAGTAGADGDPASDILITTDAYVPFQGVSKRLVAKLNASVAAVYTSRYRIKVAVIATKIDLGSVPSLFNKPQVYAKFLGQEISTVYVGPLLIVMPAGFGVYDGGRSTAAERRVLKKLRVDGRSPDALVRSATTAVQKLNGAKALRSKDIHAPSVFPQTAFVHAGETVMLKYSVLEDSERTRDFVRIFVGSTEAKTIKTPLRVATYTKGHSVQWTVPADATASTVMKFCIVATDPSGNSSLSSCAAIKLQP